MKFFGTRISVAALAASVTITCVHSAFAANRVHYTIALTNPEKHVVEVTIDAFFEVGDAVEDPSSDGVLGDETEEALDLIEP